MSGQSLRWSFLVATYKRPDVLRICLKLAAGQTRPPSEIVVVDASDGWEASRDACVADLATARFEGRLQYVAAERRSLTAQRNQGLKLVRGDVVFLFDDDSLMFPDCAAEILRVYEAFPEAAGVRASEVTTPPVSLDGAGAVKPSGYTGWAGGLRDLPAARWALRNVLMQDAALHFIPYRGWKDHAVSAGRDTVGLQASPERLFPGFTMTFRRRAMEGLEFDSALSFYAAGEDLDFTYRVGEVGPLFVAESARVYHHQAASGRLPRGTVITLGLLNMAYFLRKHSGPRLDANRRAYFARLARRSVAELLKDSLSRRWTLPQFRGVIKAAKLAPAVFALDDATAEERYRTLQQSLIE